MNSVHATNNMLVIEPEEPADWMNVPSFDSADRSVGVGRVYSCNGCDNLGFGVSDYVAYYTYGRLHVDIKDGDVFRRFYVVSADYVIAAFREIVRA